MAARYVRIGQYPDYRDEIRGKLSEILASTANPGTYAAPEDVAGCTLEMGADGLWTGNVGTLTQVQADALVASGAMASVKVGTPGNVAGALVRYGGARWVRGGFYFRPNVVSMGGHLAAGLGGLITATSVDSRKAIVLGRDCSRVRFYFRGTGPEGTTLRDSDATADATVSMCVELVSGKIIPVTFNGSRKGSLTSGGGLLSDPVFIGPRAKTYQFFARSRATMASGGVIGVQAANRNYEGVALNASDLTNGTGTAGYTVSSGALMFAPTLVLSDDPPVGPEKATIFLGDSITMGIADAGEVDYAGPGRWGWAERTCFRQFPGWVCGYSGGLISQFLVNSVPRLHTEMALFGVDRAVIAFGANDCVGKTTEPQVAILKAQFVSAFQQIQSLGISEIYAALILPRTQSTVGFVTTANQTPVSGFGAGESREALNTWFLSGADGYVKGTIDTLTGVASGTVWLGDQTHDGVHPLAIAALTIATSAIATLTA